MRPIGLPNYITLSRFFFIPGIAYSYLRGEYGLALFFLFIAGFSDLLDGFLARRLKQRSKLGAILDPAADKVLMLVSFGVLAFTQKIPGWLFILVVGRDVYIVLGVLILKLACKKLYIKPTYLSKLTTFSQLSLLSLCLLLTYLEHAPQLNLQSFEALMLRLIPIGVWAVAFLTIGSGLQYTGVGINLFRGKLDHVSYEEEVKTRSQ